MSRFFSSARFAAALAVAATVFGAGIVSGAAGQALIIGGANQAGVSNTSLDTTSSGFAWQMFQHGSGVGVYAISENGVALAGLAHNGNQHALSVTNDGTAGTGAAIIADGKNNTAADLRVNSNSIAPLKVNSTALVANLNSDLLDGFHGNGLTRLAYNFDDNDALVGTSGTALSTTITTPFRGWLSITASSDVFGTGSVTCNLDVDGTNIAASNRTVGGAAAHEENCSTNAGYYSCGGTHTVSLEGVQGASTRFDETTIEVSYSPYNGAGNIGSIFSCIIIIPSPEFTPDN